MVSFLQGFGTGFLRAANKRFDDSRTAAREDEVRADEQRHQFLIQVNDQLLKDAGEARKQSYEIDQRRQYGSKFITEPDALDAYAHNLMDLDDAINTVRNETTASADNYVPGAVGPQATAPVPTTGQSFASRYNAGVESTIAQFGEDLPFDTSVYKLQEPTQAPPQNTQPSLSIRTLDSNAPHVQIMKSVLTEASKNPHEWLPPEQVPLFQQLVGSGKIYEAHAMLTPQGQGLDVKEGNAMSREIAQIMGGDIIPLGNGELIIKDLDPAAMRMRNDLTRMSAKIYAAVRGGRLSMSPSGLRAGDITPQAAVADAFMLLHFLNDTLPEGTTQEDVDRIRNYFNELSDEEIDEIAE